MNAKATLHYSVHRKIGAVFQRFRRHAITCEQKRLLGQLVKPVQIGVIRQGQIVIAHNRRDLFLLDALNHSFRVRAIADIVAQTDYAIHARAFDI